MFSQREQGILERADKVRLAPKCRHPYTHFWGSIASAALLTERVNPALNCFRFIVYAQHDDSGIIDTFLAFRSKLGTEDDAPHDVIIYPHAPDEPHKYEPNRELTAYLWFMSQYISRRFLKNRP